MQRCYWLWQNLLENWDGTLHLLDVSWRYVLKNIFFRNKTFFFQEPHKISTHLPYSDKCYFHLFLSVVWLSWNLARFHEIKFQTEPESFSFLSWKKPLSISKQKSFVYCLNFPEGFGEGTQLANCTILNLVVSIKIHMRLQKLFNVVVLMRPTRWTLVSLMSSMAIRFVEFSNGGYKIRKVFA